MSLIENALSPAWQNYLDLQNDVKPWLQLATGPTQYDANLQVIIDGICTWAQQYLGRPIAPTLYNRRFDGWSGWNGAYIELPYYPVLEIVECVEWWGGSGPHNLQEQTPTNQVDGFQCDYLTGTLTRVFPGLVQKPWFPGSRNIQVIWKAGYQPLPGDIKIATLEDIAHWYRNTQQAAANGFGGAIGGASAYDPEQQNNGLWVGTPYRVAGILDAYKQQGIG